MALSTLLVAVPTAPLIARGQSPDSEEPPSRMAVVVISERNTPQPIPVSTPVPAQNTPEPTPVPAVYDLSSLKQLAKQICDETFGEGQFIYLDHIITVESGWNIRATEKRTGAYGLGQALPATKMSRYGEDYETNPKTQLLWMVSYIQARYGIPESAWSFHLSHGWY